MQSPIIGASLDPKKTGSEVDIMECFKPNVIAPHNVFTGGYGLDMQRRFTGGMSFSTLLAKFHTFGLLWLPDRYVFYVDGKEDGTITENVSATEEFILISTEAMGYRHEDHRPIAEAIATVAAGDSFLVDHVRVFDII